MLFRRFIRHLEDADYLNLKQIINADLSLECSECGWLGLCTVMRLPVHTARVHTQECDGTVTIDSLNDGETLHTFEDGIKVDSD